MAQWLNKWANLPMYQCAKPCPVSGCMEKKPFANVQMTAFWLRETLLHGGKNDKRNVWVAIGTTTALSGFPQPV